MLWLLEELGREYEVVRYERDPRTMLAPPALRAVHPLGKAPVLEDGPLRLAESGAIVEHLIATYGQGRLAPPRGSEPRCREWLHYAEGSAMTPLLLRLYLGRVGEAAAPVLARVEGQVAAMLDHVAAELGGGPFLMGDALTGADVMMSFPLEVAAARGGLGRDGLDAYLRRLHARPACRRALERGGPYAYAG